MSQDSSDEESEEEEEDFAQVQFGSRYTNARCVLMRVCARLHMDVLTAWSIQWLQQVYHQGCANIWVRTEKLMDVQLLDGLLNVSLYVGGKYKDKEHLGWD